LTPDPDEAASAPEFVMLVERPDFSPRSHT
jgi:hypothetical protein